MAVTSRSGGVEGGGNLTFRKKSCEKLSGRFEESTEEDDVFSPYLLAMLFGNVWIRSSEGCSRSLQAQLTSCKLLSILQLHKGSKHLKMEVS